MYSIISSLLVSFDEHPGDQGQVNYLEPLRTRSARILHLDSSKNLTSDFYKVIIQAPKGYGIFVTGTVNHYISIEHSSDKIEMSFDSSLAKSNRVLKYRSEFERLTLTLKIKNIQDYNTLANDNEWRPEGIKLIATAFRNNPSIHCYPVEFRCPLGECIWDGFRCDRQANCPDGFDEVVCYTPPTPSTTNTEKTFDEKNGQSLARDINSTPKFESSTPSTTSIDVTHSTEAPATKTKSTTVLTPNSEPATAKSTEPTTEPTTEPVTQSTTSSPVSEPTQASTTKDNTEKLTTNNPPTSTESVQTTTKKSSSWNWGSSQFHSWGWKESNEETELETTTYLPPSTMTTKTTETDEKTTARPKTIQINQIAIDNSFSGSVNGPSQSETTTESVKYVDPSTRSYYQSAREIRKQPQLSLRSPHHHPDQEFENENHKRTERPKQEYSGASVCITKFVLIISIALLTISLIY